MKTSVYVADDLIVRAGSKLHRAKPAGYSVSELVQVGLTMLADAPVKDVRAAVRRREESSAPKAVDVPGLRSGARPVS
jgi:hypothetical protein